MSEARVSFEYCDQLVDRFEHVIKHPVKSDKKEPIYYTGVDLGTACVVVAVLDENFEPVAGAYRWASVVRDGMVVDYVGAIHMVREMKEELAADLKRLLMETDSDTKSFLEWASKRYKRQIPNVDVMIPSELEDAIIVVTKKKGDK